MSKLLMSLGKIFAIFFVLAPTLAQSADEPYPAQVFNYPALTEDARFLLEKNIIPRKDRSINLSPDKPLGRTPMQLTKVTATGPNGTAQESYRKDPIADSALKDAAVDALNRLFKGETVAEAYVTDKEFVVKGKLIELDFFYIDQSNPNARILIKAEDQAPFKEAFLTAVKKNYTDARVEELNQYKGTKLYFGFLLDGKAMAKEQVALEDAIATLMSRMFSGSPSTDGQYKAKGEKGEEIEIARNKDGTLSVIVDGTSQVASFQFFHVVETRVNGKSEQTSKRYLSYDDFYLNVLTRRHIKSMFEPTVSPTPVTPTGPPVKFEELKGPRIVEIPVAKLESTVLIPAAVYAQKLPTFLETKAKIAEAEPKFDRVINKALAQVKVQEVARESLLSATGKVDKDSAVTALIQYNPDANVILVARKSFMSERFKEINRSYAFWFAIVQAIPEVGDGRAFSFAFSLQSHFRTNKEISATKLDSFLGELLATKEGLKLIALVDFLEGAEKEILKQAETAPAALRQELRDKANGIAEPARRARDESLAKRIREVLNSAE